MFERFTKGARRVVVFAQEEARTSCSPMIETSDILVGLLREEQGLAGRILESLGVTVALVQARVGGEQHLFVEPNREMELPFNLDAKGVLELALREALGLGHNYIGTEHILLGCVRDAECEAARILTGLGHDAVKIRGEVRRMLSGPGCGAVAAQGEVVTIGSLRRHLLTSADGLTGKAARSGSGTDAEAFALAVRHLVRAVEILGL
jgi:ATP-dependent Clp protease ATP-binding subunit ClpC